MYIDSNSVIKIWNSFSKG